MILENSRLGRLIKRIFFFILIKSISTSVKKNKRNELKKKLQEIVPSLTDQYTTKDIRINDNFSNEKLRSLHAFQVNFLLNGMSHIVENNDERKKQLNIIDIGDSSGNHAKYLSGLQDITEKLNLLSIDIDPLSVEKIKSKGLKAVCCRAEEIGKLDLGFKPDMMYSLQMLEHLTDPARFLYNLSKNNVCDYFAMTVPYVKNSRVGLKHLRKGIDKNVSPEECHIFELNPQDWKLLSNFAGWEIVNSEVYLQYPKLHPLYLTKTVWKHYDFEGFLGIMLKRKYDLANRYLGW